MSGQVGIVDKLLDPQSPQLQSQNILSITHGVAGVAFESEYFHPNSFKKSRYELLKHPANDQPGHTTVHVWWSFLASDGTASNSKRRRG